MPFAARPLSAAAAPSRSAPAAASPDGRRVAPSDDLGRALRSSLRGAPRPGFDPSRFRRLRPGWAPRDAAGFPASRSAAALRRAALALLLSLAPSVADAASWCQGRDGRTWTHDGREDGGADRTDSATAGLEAVRALLDLDSFWDAEWSPHELTLAAGTWEVSLNADGPFDAWNAWGGATRGCDGAGAGCDKGWMTEFVVSSATLGTLWGGGAGRYASAEKAVQGFEPLVFTLLEAETVRFYNGDGWIWDNVGGTSLTLTLAELEYEAGSGALTSEIPLPGALPLAAAGAAALFAVSRRRRG